MIKYLTTKIQKILVFFYINEKETKIKKISEIQIIRIQFLNNLRESIDNKQISIINKKIFEYKISSKIHSLFQYLYTRCSIFIWE